MNIFNSSITDEILSTQRFKSLGRSDMDELVKELMDVVKTEKRKLDEDGRQMS